MRNLIFDGSTFSATGPFRLAIFFFNVRLTLGFPPLSNRLSRSPPSQLLPIKIKFKRFTRGRREREKAKGSHEKFQEFLEKKNSKKKMMKRNKREEKSSRVLLLLLLLLFYISSNKKKFPHSPLSPFLFFSLLLTPTHLPPSLVY